MYRTELFHSESVFVMNRRWLNRLKSPKSSRSAALTLHTTELVLRPIEHPIPFRPGQWISLQLPVGDHPPLNRAYSLAEPRLPRVISRWSSTMCQEGKAPAIYPRSNQEIASRCQAPMGTSYFPTPDSKNLLLIGRYSGTRPSSLHDSLARTRRPPALHHPHCAGAQPC